MSVPCLLIQSRDLLQRHQSSYHEIQDNMQAIPGRTQHVPRRTPIACLNCANAKAGCDKNVPCTRCYEKNLPCEARYARRISKVAVRAAAAAPLAVSPMNNGLPLQLGQMDVDMNMNGGRSPYSDGNNNSPKNSMRPTPQMQTPVSNDGLMFSEGGIFCGEGLDGTSNPTMGMDFSDGFDAPNMDFQEFLSWGGEYPIVLDNFKSPGPGFSSNLETFDMPTSDLSEATSSSYVKSTASSRGSISTAHTRQSSHASPISPAACRNIDPRIKAALISEFEAVVAAEDAWPLARCNRPIFSDTCPRTAIVHLETLEQNSQNNVVWESLMENPETALTHQPSISIVPLNPTTRDKILAITQSFLHKALNTHRGGSNGWPKAASQVSPGGGFSFLVLPPAETLEYFLQNYVRTLTSYYSLINGGTVDPNELMLNNQASTLLVLLMIAEGATAIASPEARQLTAGLTETCRISLFDLIEKDVELSADPIVLRCALLFTMLAAWGMYFDVELPETMLTLVRW